MQFQAREWGDFLTLEQAACWFGRSAQWVWRQKDLLDLGFRHRLYHLRSLQSFRIARMLGLDPKTTLRFQGAALADFYKLPREMAPDEVEHVEQVQRFYEPLPPATEQAPIRKNTAFWDALDKVWNRLTSLFKPYRFYGKPRPWATSQHRAPPCNTANPYPCLERRLVPT